MTVSDVSRQYRAALLEAVQVAVDDDRVQILRGVPGPQQADDIVALLDLDSTQDVATMSPNRAREQELSQTVRVSVWRKGGVEQQAIAEDRAYDLLNAVEEYVRAVDTTLGQTVRHCFCTSHTFTTDTVQIDTSEGRLVEIDAVFTARARITS